MPNKCICHVPLQRKRNSSENTIWFDSALRLQFHMHVYGVVLLINFTGIILIVELQAFLTNKLTTYEIAINKLPTDITNFYCFQYGNYRFSVGI